MDKHFQVLESESGYELHEVASDYTGHVIPLRHIFDFDSRDYLSELKQMVLDAEKHGVVKSELFEDEEFWDDIDGEILWAIPPEDNVVELNFN